MEKLAKRENPRRHQHSLFFFWSVGLTSALFPIQFHICWRDKENDLFIRTWRENTHGGRIKYCVRLVCVCVRALVSAPEVLARRRARRKLFASGLCAIDFALGRRRAHGLSDALLAPSEPKQFESLWQNHRGVFCVAPRPPQ